VLTRDKTDIDDMYIELSTFVIVFSANVTPQRDGLATPQRELTRKNQTVRFNVVLLM